MSDFEGIVDLEPAAFDRTRNRWVRGHHPDSPLQGNTHSLTLVTWNVWFGGYHLARRAEALLSTVRSCDPDVVCFQEVTPPFLEPLLQQEWLRDNYWISDSRGYTFESYGVLMLSRLPLHSLRLFQLPSYMGRKLLLAEVETAAGRVAVGTVHLESLRPHASMRAQQLRLIFPLLKSAAPDSVLMGDFNFCSSWAEENAHVDPEFQDLWPALHGEEPGYSEDTTRNPMLLAKEGKRKQVRYDRVLLRSAHHAWKPARIRILGAAPVGEDLPDVFPSDHFGLAAILE